MKKIKFKSNAKYFIFGFIFGLIISILGATFADINIIKVVTGFFIFDVQYPILLLIYTLSNCTNDLGCLIVYGLVFFTAPFTYGLLFYLVALIIKKLRGGR
ncbi:MAG TPA: hypothetical protein VJB94_04220 [Candidatus Nanoarchaeia archaeon]|nr:hypothetical protein [Candidatus Nanoarchaeia archaeon]